MPAGCSSASPAVEIHGLNVSLGGRRVLTDVHLTLARGQLVALIGPNGAGKTTLLRSMLGLVPIESGEIRLLGAPGWRPALARLGYVPQRLALDSGLALNVREFLCLRRRETWNWFWKSDQALDAAAPSVVEEMGVRPLLDRPVTALSGGQLQRVLIAFSLMNDPEILLLDEPTEGVDAPGERTFYEIISEIHQRRRLTVVIVSHDLSMVHRHASWVVALNGRVCCEGEPDAIMRGDALQQAYGHHVTAYHHHHHPAVAAAPAHGHDHSHDHGPRPAPPSSHGHLP